MRVGQSVFALLACAMLAGCSGDSGSQVSEAATSNVGDDDFTTSEEHSSASSSNNQATSGQGSTSGSPASGSTSPGSTSGANQPPNGNPTQAPDPVTATCTLTVTAGNVAGPCSSGDMISSTNASFTKAKVTLAYTGQAAPSLTFQVVDSAGAVLGEIVGTASPLVVDLTADAIPDGGVLALGAQVRATAMAAFSGEVTFEVS